MGGYSSGYSSGYDIGAALLSWTNIRTEVKDLIDGISGLSTHARASNKVTDSATASVIPSDHLIRPAAHGGKVEVNFSVRVTAYRATLEDSQDAIDAFIWPVGSSSILAAIEVDRTLNGNADDVEWLDVSNYEQLPESQAVRADLNFRALVTP